MIGISEQYDNNCIEDSFHLEYIFKNALVEADKDVRWFGIINYSYRHLQLMRKSFFDYPSGVDIVYSIAAFVDPDTGEWNVVTWDHRSGADMDKLVFHTIDLLVADVIRRINKIDAESKQAELECKKLRVR